MVSFILPLERAGKSLVGFLLLQKTLGLAPAAFTQNESPLLHLKSSLLGTKNRPQNSFIRLQLSSNLYKATHLMVPLVVLKTDFELALIVMVFVVCLPHSNDCAVWKRQTASIRAVNLMLCCWMDC